MSLDRSPVQDTCKRVGVGSIVENLIKACPGKGQAGREICSPPEDVGVVGDGPPLRPAGITTAPWVAPEIPPITGTTQSSSPEVDSMIAISVESALMIDCRSSDRSC